MIVNVPMDTTTNALDGDAVAQKFRDAGCEVIRRGSRGLCYLEPLVEVEVDGRQIGFGPVAPADVTSVLQQLAAGEPAAHPLCVGEVHAIDYLARQKRQLFARAGEIIPTDLAAYQRLGGWLGLRRALTLGPDRAIDEIRQAGLRGRGGAAFPAHIKWRTVCDTPGTQKYIVCNADEGDSGTFADRLLMEADPFQLIEGMAIAGITTGATVGLIYLRSEYPAAATTLTTAIQAARAANILGTAVLGSKFAFDIEVRIGAGAYICGEETALLDSLEGKRGMVRSKPPVPAISGLWGCPTLLHNVLTLAAAVSILAEGSAAYAALGRGASTGTMPFQLGGNVRRGGLVEVAFGLTLRELVDDFGGGTASGRPLKAVQAGGPLGAYIAEADLDVVLGYEEMAAIGAMLGHGGLVIFDDTADMGAMARFAFEFCAAESCGKCTPCRIGSVRGVELVDRLRAGVDVDANLIVLQDLCDTMVSASLCQMGGLTPNPVQSVVRQFRHELVGKPQDNTS